MNEDNVKSEKVAYSVISDEEQDTILHLLMKLHGVVASANRGTSGNALVAFAECGEKEYEFVLNRTLNALKRKSSNDSAKIWARAKLGVDTAIEAARDAEAEAFAEWSALSPALQKRFPYKAPKSVTVQVSDILGSFPKGWTVQNATKVLSDHGYAIHCPSKDLMPGQKGRPASDPTKAQIVADRVAASTADGTSTLPHGNGERVELSQGQAIAAAR
jgi:hypothetical protein